MMGISEEKEREKGAEKKIIEVTMAENFPQLMTETKP